MHDKPPCDSATRLRAVLAPSGLSAMDFLTEAIPEYLDLLVQQLLDAPTEDEFHRIRNEALGEYATLSAPNKRELIRRVSIILSRNSRAKLAKTCSLAFRLSETSSHPKGGFDEIGAFSATVRQERSTFEDVEHPSSTNVAATCATRTRLRPSAVHRTPRPSPTRRATPLATPPSVQLTAGPPLTLDVPPALTLALR